ncbi:DUF488 domain-containing protein [Geobacillus zalihae]|uniref:DUF488 domain-containing protein n=1 Tax=Geobacillus zalihae TaxID=213419 RepID=UPI0016808288|nr:DUF488 domain-containing protein [Geobacillus zalihae]QNU25064.1 DUF488 domain-containing protein [Geobacillus zalihae]
MKFLTIGVYGYSEEEFFSTLVANKVDVFIDIRLRRGMRGKKYSFVNSSYLQNRLKELNISYLHLKELAPTEYVREQQKIEDKARGKSKQSRTELGQSFINAYREICLSRFDPNDLIKKLDPRHKVAVLFCVEATPNACHRGLVADFLKEHGYSIYHIVKE